MQKSRACANRGEPWRVQTAWGAVSATFGLNGVAVLRQGLRARRVTDKRVLRGFGLHFSHIHRKSNQNKWNWFPVSSTVLR